MKTYVQMHTPAHVYACIVCVYVHMQAHACNDVCMYMRVSLHVHVHMHGIGYADMHSMCMCMTIHS